jgi:PAP2 superfamily
VASFELATPAPAQSPARALLRPFVSAKRGLDRVVWFFDGSEVARSKGANRLRRGVALLFLAYGLELAVSNLAKGAFPSMGQGILLMLAVALFVNRGGEFVRDLLAVVLALFSYGLVSTFAEKLNFTVHYSPQIDSERFLFHGTLPTVWLQHHLGTARTGPLAVFSVLMYLSHFVVPAVLGFALWVRRKRRTFQALMFGLITVTLLGEMTFVLAPTAPPWLASQQGLTPHVHHLLKQALAGLHLDQLAVREGNAHSYNIVAAMPSLHAAFPIVGLLVATHYGLSRWIRAALVLQFLGVCFAIVYMGDHYVVDAIVGVAYASVAWFLVRLGLRADEQTPRAEAEVGYTLARAASLARLPDPAPTTE